MESRSQRIIETLTYSTLFTNSENIWSLLFAAGYLTLAGKYYPNGSTQLKLSNYEIRNLFASSVDEWFTDVIRKDSRTDLFDSLWNSSADSLSEIVSQYLFDTISYYDYREDYYHAFLAGLLSGAGYTVRSNRESGDGRPDIILLDRKGGKAAVFELKKADSIDGMEKAADKAINQLRDRDYGDDLTDYDEIISFGISFFRKRALVKVSDKKSYKQ